MAVNIGPKIGIDGEAQFRKEINGLIQQQKTLASEMKSVTSSFDENDKSQKKLTAQSQVLSKQIETQKSQIDLLKKGLNEASKAFGETDSKTLKWQQAVNEATAELNKMQGQLKTLENKVDDVGDAMQEAGNETASFANTFSALGIVEAVKGIGSAIADVVESTKEYRTIIASLDISSQKAGYSAEETAQSFEQLYGVLADDQTTATTTANLQALGLEQSELTELTDAAIGAWATYGDSIPIDGLAEAVNETVKAGQVTGVFADVLNWGSQEGEAFGVTLKANTKANEEWNKAVESATTAEDFFNLALSEASTEAERADLVLQAMANQGLVEAGKAWQQNNEDIVAANNAQLDFQENAAELAQRVSPAVTAIKDGFNAIFKEILNLTENLDFSAITQEIQEGFSYLTETVLPEIVGFFKFVFENKELLISAIAGIGAAFVTWNVASVIVSVAEKITTFNKAIDAGKTAMQALNLTFKANPFAIIATAVVGVTAALVTLWNTNEDFRNAVVGVWENIQQMFADAWQFIQSVWDKAKPYFDSIWQFIKQVYSAVAPVIGGFFSAAWNGIVAVWNVAKSYFSAIWETIKGIFSVVEAVLSGDFSAAWEAIKNVFSSWGDFFNGLWNLVVNAFGGVVEFFANIGKNIVQGIKDGIASAWNGLVNWFNGLWDSLFGKKTVNVEVNTAETRVVKTVQDSGGKNRPSSRLIDSGPENPISKAKTAVMAAYETISPMTTNISENIQRSRYRVETAMSNAASYIPTTPKVNGKAKGESSVNFGGVTIVVNPAPGMDENALANRVAEIIQQMTERKAGVFV